MTTKSDIRRERIITTLERLGYERVPRTRQPAVFAKASITGARIEQHVYRDGSLSTWAETVGGRLRCVAVRSHDAIGPAPG